MSETGPAIQPKITVNGDIIPGDKYVFIGGDNIAGGSSEAPDVGPNVVRAEDIGAEVIASSDQHGAGSSMPDDSPLGRNAKSRSLPSTGFELVSGPAGPFPRDPGNLTGETEIVAVPDVGSSPKRLTTRRDIADAALRNMGVQARSPSKSGNSSTGFKMKIDNV